MTPVQKSVLFFSVCLVGTLAFAVGGFAKGSVGQGVVGLVVGALALWLVVRGVRLARDGVHFDYRRPVWERQAKDKPGET